MNRDDFLHNIAKLIGRLTAEIRALNAVGRFDINSVTEDFLVPVLKLTFDCPDLRNQNQIQANFPAVDLGCRTTKVSFQVTTDASSGKVVYTLDKFREHALEKVFDRIYILTLIDKQSTYKSRSLANAISSLAFEFDPKENILDVSDLLVLIRRLDTEKLERIHAYLQSEWIKREEHLKFRDQLQEFLAFSTNKIAAEKKTRKYIPSIFVETHSAKEEMRLFANPMFFYRKIQDELRRVDYGHINSLMKLANEPNFSSEVAPSMLDDSPSTFAELAPWLDRVIDAVDIELAKIRPLSWRREEGEEYKPADGESAGWFIARFQAESVATGLTFRLLNVRSAVDLIRNKIFLITSMAGQGKTNFVCDLVENQFRLFGIPCLFIPGRELNRYPQGQRILNYISDNRYAPNFTKLHQYLVLFNSIALENNKPFLLVIDGINEVGDLATFNDELNSFCAAVCQYDMVKIVITCRSEFFDEKFSGMLNEPFGEHIHRVNDLRAQMTDQGKNRLLSSYFGFFQIKGRLSKTAEKFLKNDLLLLRIFCERYEGCDIGHRADIYKGDLFEAYLSKKIQTFPSSMQPDALPTLFKIVSSMLETGDYSQLSVRTFSEREREVVRRFVEDDVILRQEVGAKGLGSIGDLVISFTYDELRDFIIAYKMFHDVPAHGADKLGEMLMALPGQPIYEGVYRYVYLLARNAKSNSVVAVCEQAEDFIEHFSLNVHLIPPAVQTADDVIRVRAILSEASNQERIRRVAFFLVHRRELSESLNISILLEHLNGLETHEHARFVSVLFSHQNDYRGQDWQQRIQQLVQNVWEDFAEGKIETFASEWLVFFLHAVSQSNRTDWERISTKFREFKGAPNFSAAIDWIREARAQSVQLLLADIEAAEEVLQ